MRWLEVNGGVKLNGSVAVQGSKNSALGLLAASCLSNEAVKLENIPNILDIRQICEIGKSIGLDITIEKNTYTIDPTKINNAIIPPDKAAAFRASYYFIGALLAKFKKVSIGYPGGDNFGSRPIDQHIKGLEALGAKFTFYNDYYVVEAEKLVGKEIYFDVITSGATMNLLLAAVLAEGKTVLKNAARDPEIVDVAVFLSEMGANIRGAGTDTIIIEGVKELHGCTHAAMPDRLIAGSFIMAAGVTRGLIKVEDIIPEHLFSCTEKLKETGLSIECGDNFVKVDGNLELKGINVKATMYPGFATDFQQPLTAMLTGASGHSVITDTVYPKRFGHCVQLNRMGADIIFRDGYIVVPGNKQLKGNWVHATDVRAGTCLVLAALGAEGTTYITGVEHIERGYVDLVGDFKKLGVDVVLKEDESVNMGIM